jgi:lipooligosaccharide transport system permease protein
MYYQKTFDAIIATPLSIEEVIAGELLWGATRAVINTLIMLPVLFAFGVVNIPLSLFMIPFSFFGGLLFATTGMCFTALTPRIDSLNLPTFLFITPMFLFSGTFFPLSLLPTPLQSLAQILPLTHLVEVTRSLALAQIGAGIGTALLYTGVVTAFLFVVSINLMKKRLIA